MTDPIETLKEPMACRHPKACWIDTPQGSALMGTFYSHAEIVAGGHCTACEHERLAIESAVQARDSAIERHLAGTEPLDPKSHMVYAIANRERLVRAAALREAQAVARGVYQSGEYENERSAIEAADAVLAMLSAADQKVLDAHDAELLEEVSKHPLVPSIAGTPKYECGIWFNLFIPAAVEEWRQHIRALKRGSK